MNEPFISSNDIEKGFLIEKDSEFTCGICYCEYPSDKVRMLSKCRHKFCQECFSEFYTSLVME